METDPSPVTTLAEDYEPPKPWKSFDVRFRSGGNKRIHQAVVDHLSDEEIYWVARVLAAELNRRQRSRKIA